MLFISRSLPPLVSTIPPFESEAIAQTTDTKVVVPPDPRIPQPNYLPSDFPSLLLTAILSGGAVWLAIAKFGAKVGDAIIAEKQSRASLEIEERQIELANEKAMREAALTESGENRKIISTVLQTTLSNVLQTSRESGEQYYLLLDKYNELIATQKAMLAREEKRDRLLQDIANVLKIRERDSA